MSDICFCEWTALARKDTPTSDPEISPAEFSSVRVSNLPAATVIWHYLYQSEHAELAPVILAGLFTEPTAEVNVIIVWGIFGWAWGEFHGTDPEDILPYKERAYAHCSITVRVFVKARVPPA